MKGLSYFQKLAKNDMKSNISYTESLKVKQISSTMKKKKLGKSSEKTAPTPSTIRPESSIEKLSMHWHEIPSDEIVVFEANPTSHETSVNSLEVDESMRDLT